MRFISVSLAIILALDLPTVRLSAQATAAAPTQPIVVTDQFFRQEYHRHQPPWRCFVRPGGHYDSTVVLTVDPSGKPVDPQTVQTSDLPCADEIAIAAVKAAQFTPATGADGKPIVSIITIPVKYALTFGPSPEEKALIPRVTFDPGISTGHCTLHQTTHATVSLIVKADGTPDNIKLYRTSGDTCLDERAIEIAAQYRFSPGTKDGHPVDAPLYISINFQKF